MKNSTYSRRSQMVSTVKKVARHDPGGLLPQERPPRGAGPPRCGVEVVTAEGGADAEAETWVPSRRSSPWMRW
jgi:hypothetical protein